MIARADKRARLADLRGEPGRTIWHEAPLTKSSAAMVVMSQP
jgi:hypothetical protein